MIRYKVIKVIGPEGKALAISAKVEFIVDYSIVDGHIDLDVGELLRNKNVIVEEVSTHNSFMSAKYKLESLLNEISVSKEKLKKEIDELDISID